MIWERIKYLFRGRERQLEVIKLLIKYGLSIRNGSIFLENLRIPFSSIASALEVDRRVVMKAVKTVEKDEDLKVFFSNLLPAGPFLRNVSKLLGYTTIIIVPYKDQPGIIANISAILAQAGLNIVQVIAEEPHLTYEQKLYIIVEEEVPGEIINKIMKIDFVKNVILG